MPDSSGTLMRLAVLFAKCAIIAVIAIAVMVGLFGGRCLAPNVDVSKRPDVAVVRGTLGYYSILMERLADHHRDAGNMETSARLLRRVFNVQARILDPGDAELIRIEEKYEQQFVLRPNNEPGQVPDLNRNHACTVG